MQMTVIARHLTTCYYVSIYKQNKTQRKEGEENEGERERKEQIEIERVAVCARHYRY